MTLSATWIKDSWGFRPSLPYTGGSGFGGSGLGTGSGGIGRGSGSYLIAVPPFLSRSCQQLRKGSLDKESAGAGRCSKHRRLFLARAKRCPLRRTLAEGAT